ncbi:MAG TPA: hypothetical protein VGL75_17140 [Acidothermaceae bacterium]|jgi:hypothetical protein
MTISPDDEGLGWQPSDPPAQRIELLGPLAPRPLAKASIVTPGNWIELDLDASTRHTSIRRAVRRAIVRSRALAPDAIPLIALLDRLTTRANNAGAFYCASRVIEDTKYGALVATVVMQICEVDTVVFPGERNPSVAERCVALVAVIDGDPIWTGANAGVVTLPFVGAVVRLCVENDGIVVQYIVPLFGCGAHVVVTFTSTCPPYARIMTELFDTMAQSLELHY